MVIVLALGTSDTAQASTGAPPIRMAAPVETDLAPLQRTLLPALVAVQQAAAIRGGGRADATVLARLDGLERELREARAAYDRLSRRAESDRIAASAALDDARERFRAEADFQFQRLGLPPEAVERYRADLAEILPSLSVEETAARRRLADGDLSVIDRLEELKRTRLRAQEVASQRALRRAQAPELREIAANYALAWARGELGRTTAELLRRWDEAASYDPDDFSTQLERARLARLLGRMPEALEAGTRAVALAATWTQTLRASREAMVAAAVTKRPGSVAAVEPFFDQLQKNLVEATSARDQTRLSRLLWDMIAVFGPVVETMESSSAIDLTEVFSTFFRQPGLSGQAPADPTAMSISATLAYLMSIPGPNEDDIERLGGDIGGWKLILEIMVASDLGRSGLGFIDGLEQRLDRLRARDGDSPALRFEAARLLALRADVLADLNDPGAMAAADAAIAAFDALTAIDPGILSSARVAHWRRLQRGRLEATTGDRRRAIATWRAVVEACDAALDGDPTLVDTARLRAAARRELAGVEGGGVRWRDVVRDYDRLKERGWFNPIDEAGRAEAVAKAAGRAAPSVRSNE